MKSKLRIVFIVSVLTAVMLGGCGKSAAIDTDVVTIKQYDNMRKDPESYEKATQKDKKELEKLSTEDIWKEITYASKVKSYDKEELKEKKEQIQSAYQEIADQLKLKNLDEYYEKYLINEDDKNMDGYLTRQAKVVLKENYIVDAIAEKEDIKLTDAVYEKEYKTIAKDFNIKSVKELKEQASSEKDLKQLAKNRIVKKWVYDHADKEKGSVKKKRAAIIKYGSIFFVMAVIILLLVAYIMKLIRQRKYHSNKNRKRRMNEKKSARKRIKK